MTERRDEFLAELTSQVSRDSPILGDVMVALGEGGSVQSFFVRPETVFDQDSVYDSIAAFAVTGNRLLVVVSDVSYEFSQAGEFITTTQFVNLDRIRDFQIIRRRVADGPEAGALASVHMRLRWGAGWQHDIRPASCDNPNCDADHGYMAVITGEDGEIVLDHTLDESTFRKGLRFIDELSAILAARAV
ncbi:DUF5998 family protein [Actinomycetaceae bacterium L2_0104]